jgi:hydroxyethylthiazole kinase-like sugar kinase family protein
VAAEIAAEGCTGPGTFATGFLDALADVGPADVAKRAMIS